MSFLGDDFRRRAEEYNAEAAKLFASPEFPSSPKVQVSTTVAKVTANVLHLLGETVDFLRASDTTDASYERRKVLAERNEALRKAFMAATTTGDYTRYDELVKEFVDAASGNGSGEQ